MEITIQLQPVTSTVTRVSIDTKKGQWAKDKATANEILSQIGQILETEIAPQKRFSRVYVKNEESSSGKKFRWTGDEFQIFKGKPYDFFKIDMGQKLIDFIQTLTCD